MPLQPSRRLPHAFQRHASPLSHRIARRLSEGRAKRSFHDCLAIFGRRFRRAERLWRTWILHFKIWLAVVGILIPLAVVLFVLFSSTFQVSSIRVSRQDRRTDVEEIQKLLAPVFGKNIFFVSPALLAKKIQSAYPEVSSVVVRRSYPSTLHIFISMDDIAAEIRIGQPDDTEENFSAPSDDLFRYITDGGVYIEYPFAVETKENEKRLTLDLVDWAVKPEHRQHLIDKRLIETMRQARAILEQSFGVSVPLVTVYIRAKEFHVRTTHPGRSPEHETLVLWLDFSTPLVQQINRYRKFLQALSQSTAESYVDLRLHNRVVYK